MRFPAMKRSRGTSIGYAILRASIRMGQRYSTLEARPRQSTDHQDRHTRESVATLVESYTTFGIADTFSPLPGKTS